MDRFEIGVLAEEHRLAAAFEAGQVVQRDGRLFPDLDRAAIMPMPLRVLGAKGFVERLAVDEQLERAWRAWRVPRSHPVPGAHPHAVGARGREANLGHRIPNRYAETVGQQVGRTHLIHRLLVNFPAAEVGEAFRFQEEEFPVGCLREESVCFACGQQAQRACTGKTDELAAIGFPGLTVWHAGIW